ncbi:MAG: hypothetical protein A3I05_08255 [Deltaproteobacteria bacterium RIFCSPLOWO2_02_FULL_44_10]|nr:MAG: hypothetical protein A3I05_08255 [Deltaproteobacteria bacterium RIFCSPLOWO2_02_FULL_44_10]
MLYIMMGFKNHDFNRYGKKFNPVKLTHIKTGSRFQSNCKDTIQPENIMQKLIGVMKLLEVSETDAIKAILNLISPPPPPATRQNWTRLSTFGHSAPTSQDLWAKLEEANFKCQKCRSQMRVSFNHINGNATDHQLSNLEVVCFSCNRKVSKKGTSDMDHHFKIAMAAIELWKELSTFPTLEEIRKRAGVKQIGGATYLLKFIKERLMKKNG